MPAKQHELTALPTGDVAWVDASLIHENDWNPNVVADHVMRALGNNIQRAGFNAPVLVRPHPEKPGEYQIVDGAHRFRHLKERGEAVPVIVRNFTETEAKLQTVAMNRLRGEMEPADVARLIRDAAEDFELPEMAEFTGYDLGELIDLQENLGEIPVREHTRKHAEPGDGEETWLDVVLNVPKSVAFLLRSELDRCKGILQTEHDHLALELLVVNSSQTPPEHMSGETT